MAVMFYTRETKKELDETNVRYSKDKIFRYGKNSRAFMSLGPSHSEIMADGNGFRSEVDSGNYIFGAVGYSEPWSRMKFGRAFRGNPMVHTNMPSTINTPIPMFVYEFPFSTLKQLILNPLYKNLLSFLGI